MEWDVYYLRMARLASTKSKDPSTKTGAVIVRPDRSFCSSGFNGFPQCMEDRPEWYLNRDEKYSRIVHCEINALLFAREPVRGYTLYTWPFASCDRCCVQMLQAGITRFVFPEPIADALTRWGEAFVKTKDYITNSHASWDELPLWRVVEL